MNSELNIELLILVFIATFQVILFTAFIANVCVSRKKRRAFESLYLNAMAQCEQNAQLNLSAHKIDTAKSYASISHIKDVERRLTGHIIRVENKLDNGCAKGTPKAVDRA